MGFSMSRPKKKDIIGKAMSHVQTPDPMIMHAVKEMRSPTNLDSFLMGLPQDVKDFAASAALETQKGGQHRYTMEEALYRSSQM